MKRNMDLIRALLLEFEQDKHFNSIAGYTHNEVAYHVSLLEEANLVTQEIYINIFLNNSMLEGIRVTWAGHEFLDSTRSTPFWEKAKKVALEKTGSLSFEILKTIINQLLKDAISRNP